MPQIISTPTTAWSKITTVLDEDTFIIEYKWSEREACWMVSVYDTDEQPLMLGVKLVPWTPIVLHHQQTNLPKGDLMVVDAESDFGAGSERIGRDNFGTRFFFVYYTKSELKK